MASKNLFKSMAGKLLPNTDAINEAGGRAYHLSPKAALAQYAVTGCLNGTFYADAETQLQKVLELCQTVDAEFIAKLAMYARERGHMKDMPALLCAVLAVKDVAMLKAVFPRVIDNGKMLRNFVQIVRSGAVGRKSLGTAPKRLINEWLEARSDDAIFKDSVGQAPSLADVIKMIHPKPKTESRAALYGYFIGRDFNADALPALVRQFEQFKAGEAFDVPKVPFQMLTALPLGTNDWAEIARNAAWQMTRMNLNTFARHGVFEQAGLPELIADRLRDEGAIKKARVFPYQLLAAFTNTDQRVPAQVRDALQDAMEIALQNVPELAGQVVVCPDVSGSMMQELPLVVSSLESLTGQLDARDSIAIVVYAGASGTVLPPTSGADKRTILDALERLEAGGSTNGGAGIEHAYALAREHFVKGGINRVVLATDGDFNVGVTGHDALVKLIEAKRRSGVFLSVLGFGGANYQDSTMEQLADKGNGNYAYIDGPGEARKVLVEQVGGTLVTVAKDVKLQVDFDPSVVERYRLVGYTNRVLADRDFADDTKDAGEIGSGHTVTALYEIEPTAAPAPEADVMRIKIRYKEPDGKESRLLEVPVPHRPVALSEASTDFRFSAAVAGFGQALQALPTSTESGPLESLRDLAAGARGVDLMCRRAELVQLIERASALRGQPLEPVASSCFPAVEPVPAEPEAARDLLAVSEDPVPAVATSPVPTSLAPFDWTRFVLEVPRRDGDPVPPTAPRDGRGKAPVRLAVEKRVLEHPEVALWPSFRFPRTSARTVSASAAFSRIEKQRRSGSSASATRFRASRFLPTRR